LVLEATVRQRFSEQGFFESYVATVIDAVFVQQVPV
jgi:hypothetical protein